MDVVSKKAIFAIFLLWFAISYFVLQVFFYDTMRLYTEIGFREFLSRGVLYYFGIQPQYLFIILGLMLFLGTAAVFSQRARRLVLILAPPEAVLIAAINYMLNKEICLSSECLGKGFAGILWSGFFWMFFASIFPLAWALRSKIKNFFILLLKTILPGIISILLFTVFWFSATNPLRTKIVEWRISSGESFIQAQAESGGEIFLPLNYATEEDTNSRVQGPPLYVVLGRISESFTKFFAIFFFTR